MGGPGFVGGRGSVEPLMERLRPKWRGYLVQLFRCAKFVTYAFSKGLLDLGPTFGIDRLTVKLTDKNAFDSARVLFSDLAIDFGIFFARITDEDKISLRQMFEQCLDCADLAIATDDQDLF